MDDQDPDPDQRDLHCANSTPSPRGSADSDSLLLTLVIPDTTSVADSRLLRNDTGMMAAARLALDLALPTKQEGKHALPMPDREEHWARQLFERAVAGFYEVVASPCGWRVSAGKWLRWNERDPSPGFEAILPSMQTDIVLDHEDRSHLIVIDTKFTEIITGGWYREASLKSGCIYQMYAYLRSQEGVGDGLADGASGLLMHPTIDSDMDASAEFQGHRIRFATVDLTASVLDIRNRLLQVIQVPFTATTPDMG